MCEITEYQKREENNGNCYEDKRKKYKVGINIKDERQSEKFEKQKRFISE